MRILVVGDSLGFPRPNRINNYSLDEKELVVRYDQTYSSIIQKEFYNQLGKEKFFEVIKRSRCVR